MIVAKIAELTVDDPHSRILNRQVQVVIIIFNMVDSMRTFIAFGLTGAGKSFALNLLYGVDNPDDAN